MRYLLMATAVALSIGAFAGQASAQASGPPAKVCKNLLGKVIPCPVAKPTGPAKPGVMSHLAGLGHPAGPAAPPPHPGPAMAMTSHASGPQTPALHPSTPPHATMGGASQTSPIGATAKCKDGTYWHSKSHSGSCAHHQGVANYL